MFQSYLSDVCVLVFITKPMKYCNVGGFVLQSPSDIDISVGSTHHPTGFEFYPYGMSLNLACDHFALLNGTIGECDSWLYVCDPCIEKLMLMQQTCLFLFLLPLVTNIASVQICASYCATSKLDVFFNLFLECQCFGHRILDLPVNSPRGG